MKWIIIVVVLLFLMIILRNYKKCPECGKIVRIRRKDVKDDVVSTITHIYGKCPRCGEIVVDEYYEEQNIDPDAMP